MSQLNRNKELSTKFVFNMWLASIQAANFFNYSSVCDQVTSEEWTEVWNAL